MRNSIRFPQALKAPVLRDLQQEFRARFIDDCQVVMHDKGAPVLTQGDTVPGMYLIAHGAVEFTSINAEGQSVLIHLGRQNEVFGDVDCLSDMPAAANCVAAVQSITLLCAKVRLQAAMSDPVMLRNVMHVSYERLLRDNNIKFVDSFYPVEQRLCDYLHRLSVDRSEVVKTQADLAGLLGCARQTLNRELGRLRDKRIIEMQKGRIRVLDRDTLWALASNGPVARP